MRKSRFLAVLGLAGALLMSGCANGIKAKIPFLNKGVSKPAVVEKAYEGDKKLPQKPQAEIDKEVTAKTNEMVEKIRQGDWAGAITVGESAYALDAKNEPMLETLSEAYDFKNHLEGLTDKEKKNYIKVVRSHMSLDPANRYKKHALARALIEVGELAEGNKLALEAYNMGPDKPREIIDTYGWGLWLAKNKTEALKQYDTLYKQKPATIFQLYRAGVVFEPYDRTKAINMYHTTIIVADNAMTWDENKNNLSAISMITKIRGDAEKAEKRLLAGGNAIDSNFSLAILESIRPEQYPLR